MDPRQKKSNRVSDLGSHIWDEWAGEDGTIGKAYGYQLGVKYKFKQGEMDQVDNILWLLEHDKYSRRIMANMYNFADLSEMNLEPCAYSMTFNVKGDTLNAILNQKVPGYLDGKQLECCAVCTASYDVCTS